MTIRELNARIQNHSYFPKYSNWIFIILMLAFSIVYDYHHILFYPPQSVHLWRQCDCLSITMSYYQDSNPFFQPSIHNLGKDGTGKTVSDFPLIYFSIAQLWKIFGHHEFIYRTIILLFFYSGLYALFRIFENVLKDSVLAITGSLFLFTSPTLVYYANNFLMDIPAFSAALIGLYFFFKFYLSSSNRFLFLSAVSFTLAGLLKISSILSFIAIIGIFILELFNVKLKPDRRVFQYPLKQASIFIGALVVQVIWYTYAYYYNERHNGGIFLIGTLPIWDLNMAQISITLDAIKEHLKWDYLRRETSFVFVFMFFAVLAFYKRIDKIILLLTALVSLGLLLFSLLFFQALKDHDYYTINLFILIPMVILSFFLLLKNKFSVIYASVLFRIILIAFLIHNIDFARRRIESRYSQKGWQNENYVKNIRSFKDIPPYLHSIGIKQDDRVISLSDNSINISLYFMNQKGWTNYDIGENAEIIKEKINLGARYLFIYNKDIYQEQNIKPFITRKIGEFQNIDIYAL